MNPEQPPLEHLPAQEGVKKFEVGDVVVIDNFSRATSKVGQILKSSSPDRKIIRVFLGMGVSNLTDADYNGRPFTVRITEDTNPNDPMSGQYMAEIVPDEWVDDDTDDTDLKLSDLEIEENVKDYTTIERLRRSVSSRLSHLTGVLHSERESLSKEDFLARVPEGKRRLAEIMWDREHRYQAQADGLKMPEGVEGKIAESQRRLMHAIDLQEQLLVRGDELHFEESQVLKEVNGAPSNEELALLEEIRNERNAVEKQCSDLYYESPEAYYGLHLRDLKTYKEALMEGKIVETPYVEKQSAELESHLRAGQPVLVYGHLGTGKTELAMHVARKMQMERPDIVEKIEARMEEWKAQNGNATEEEIATQVKVIEKEETSALVISGYKHASTTEFFGHQNLAVEKADMDKVAEEIRGIEAQFEVWKNEFISTHAGMDKREQDAEIARGHERILETNLAKMQGGTITTYFLGPVYRAMQEGRIVIFDEVNAIPHEVLISLNHILTRKPGDIINVQQDSGMKIVVKEGFGIVMTGNINQGDSRYLDRQDLDPAFLSRLHRMEHDYLPQKIEGRLSAEAGKESELFQVIMARVMDKKGNMDVPVGAVDELWRLAQAARVTQEVFSGKNTNDKFYYRAGIARPQNYKLVEGVLSMRGIDKIINQWQKDGYAHDLEHYIFSEFINQPTVVADKAYLYQLFSERFGFFKDGDWPIGVDFAKLQSNFSITSPQHRADSIQHYDARDVVDFTYGAYEEKGKA